jgi:hypothetical protein
LRHAIALVEFDQQHVRVGRRVFLANLPLFASIYSDHKHVVYVFAFWAVLALLLMIFDLPDCPAVAFSSFSPMCQKLTSLARGLVDE